MKLASVLLAAAVIAVPGAFAADPGVSSDEIVIGGTAPISGPESAYAVVAQGAKAYFDYVNANGGVFGRDIRYVYLDDAYDPAQTIQQTRRLVEQERVFAIFNVVGTEHTLATRPYLNELGVPQLFVGSGATALVREAGKYPWTMGYLPSFFAEGRFYGRHIAKTRPKATIAVLYEDSDFGQDLLRGLRNGLRGKGKVVATQGYAVTEARRLVADSRAPGLEGEHAHDLRAAEADDSVLHRGGQARLAAEGVRRRGVDRPVRDGGGAAEHGEPHDRGRDVARLPQGLDEQGQVGQGRGREALLLDHEALQQGRRPEGRREHVRDGRGAHDGRGAEEGGAQPDAEEAARRGHAPQLEAEPVPAARDRRQDRARATATRSTRSSSTATRRASGGRSARSFPPAEIASTRYFLGATETREEHEKAHATCHHRRRLGAGTGALRSGARRLHAAGWTSRCRTASAPPGKVKIHTAVGPTDDTTARLVIYSPIRFAANGGTVGLGHRHRRRTRAGRRPRRRHRARAGRDRGSRADRDRPRQRRRRSRWRSWRSQCTGTTTHTAYWVFKLTAAGNALELAAFFDLTAGAEQALGTSKITFCLPPDDVPAGTPGRSPLGIKLVDAVLTFNPGVFTNPSTAGLYLWTSIWTPYNPGVGTANAAGTVSAVSATPLPDRWPRSRGRTRRRGSRPRWPAGSPSPGSSLPA